jgi:hypothetical protein
LDAIIAHLKLRFQHFWQYVDEIVTLLTVHKLNEITVLFKVWYLDCHDILKQRITEVMVLFTLCR